MDLVDDDRTELSEIFRGYPVDAETDATPFCAAASKHEPKTIQGPVLPHIDPAVVRQFVVANDGAARLA